MLHGVWDPPGPGIESVSPALAGRFLNTGPSGKPLRLILNDKKNFLKLGNVGPNTGSWSNFVAVQSLLVSDSL